jgi:hypothetical protein
LLLVQLVLLTDILGWFDKPEEIDGLVEFLVVHPAAR